MNLKMTSTHVAFFYPSITDSPGGAERLLIEEMKYFAKKGATISFFTFECTHEELCKSSPSVYTIEPKNPISRIINLIKLLKKTRPDVIITHADNVNVYLATRLVRIPYVSHIHGTSFWFPENLEKYSILHRRVFTKIRESLPGHTEFVSQKPNAGIKGSIKSEIISFLTYLAVRNSKKIFTLTNQVKNEIKLLYGKDALVVRAGCDIGQNKTMDVASKYNIKNKKIILTVNRLDPRKRLDVLISAFDILQEELENAVLLVAGEGEEASHLKKIIKERGLEHKVILAGYVDEADLPSYYASCDVFAYPGWCAYGLSALEALTFEKNVVLSCDALVSEVLTDNENAFICEPNTKEFARNLLLAINSPHNADASNEITRKLAWKNYFSEIFKETMEVLD